MVGGGCVGQRGVLGNGFWIRPLLIELTWIIGLPWFWHWQVGGGLLGFTSATLPVIAGWDGFAETWFWCHTILIALLFIATFIDFDEKLIPDQITVPGTLLGLTDSQRRFLGRDCQSWRQLPLVQLFHPFIFARRRRCQLRGTGVFNGGGSHWR